MKSSKKNQVGNFEQLVSFCTAQGSSYHPSMASIGVSALEAMLAQAKGSLEAASVSRTAYEQAINARKEVMKPLPKLARRIIAVLRENHAPKDVIDDCMAIKRRSYSRAKKVVTNTPVTTSSPDGNANGVTYRRSLSQLDKDSIIGNFQELVIRATAEPAYQTQQADLQPTALRAHTEMLRNRNTAAINAFIAMKETNRQLNEILFSNEGIYGLSLAVKAHIETVFGYRSDKHRDVLSIKFKKM